MTWTTCWHCGWSLGEWDCLHERVGEHHDDMRLMQQRENLREYWRENRDDTPYTQLANGRLYVRRT